MTGMSSHPPASRVSRARPWLEAAGLGAGLLLALHLLSLGAFLLPAWRQLTGQVREEMSALTAHILGFQAALALGVVLVGALCGVAARVLLLGLGLRPSRPRVASLGVLLAAAQVARTIALRPALFEDMLWRSGGLRARFQVALVEGLGTRGLDLLLLGLGAAWAVAALVRHRQQLLGRKALFASGAALLVALASALPIQHTSRARGRSIIILAADSLRPDRFTSEGNPRDTTPHLDALRGKSLWVANHFVPIASTTASWTSMLTGVYPHRHGIRDLFPRAEVSNVLLPTLPRMLAAQGYNTAVVSDYAGEMFNRVRYGFDVVDAPPETSVEVFADRESFQRLPLALAFFSGSLGQRFFPVARYLPVNADPSVLTERVLAQLERLEASDKPFLLVAFYSVTHAPFAPPMPDARAYTRPDYSGSSRYSYELQQLNDLARVSERPADADIEQIRALYDGSLRAFDREVGRLVERLDADGVTDRLLVVTGDHGENLFEPGTTTEHGKWFEGGDAANRTALLLQGPGIPPGTVREGLASGVDLVPTLLDALQLKVPEGLDGRSLLQPLPEERTVFAETTLWLGGPRSQPPGALTYPALLELLEVEPGTHALVLKRSWLDRTVTAKLRAARRGPWELVYMPTNESPRWRLFDLKADPHAQRDVAGEHPEVAASLRQELLRWMAKDPLRWLDAREQLVYREEQ